MGAKQSKRSVDISGKEAEGAGEVAAAGAVGEGRVEQLADLDALKPQLNGDAHIHEQTDKEKQLDSGTPENEKDATTEKEQQNEGEKKEEAPVTNGEAEPKPESGEATPADDGKKPKKEKVKKKWSLRSISFSRKDKPKQEKKQKEEEPKTNGEPEKVPEEAAEPSVETASPALEEAKSETEMKEEKTPETPVTEPLTNGSSTPETPKVETPAAEEPAPAAAPPAEPEKKEPEPQPEQLPVNGLTIEEKTEEPEAPKSESKPEEIVKEAPETVPAPEIPVKKEVCVEQVSLESPPPPLPANPPPSSVVSFAATTMAPELTDASLAKTTDYVISAPHSIPNTKTDDKVDDTVPTPITETNKIENANDKDNIETESVPTIKETIGEPAEIVADVVPPVTKAEELPLKETDEIKTDEHVAAENTEKPDIPVTTEVKNISEEDAASESKLATGDKADEVLQEEPKEVSTTPETNDNIVSEYPEKTVADDKVADVPVVSSIAESTPGDSVLDNEKLPEASVDALETAIVLPKEETIPDVQDLPIPEPIKPQEDDDTTSDPNSVDDLPPPPPLDDELQNISPPEPVVQTEKNVAEVTLELNGHDNVQNGFTESILENGVKESVAEMIECNGKGEEMKVGNVLKESDVCSERDTPAPQPAPADAAPPPAALAPAQEPLPISDKLADLIPEVPVVPELNTDTLTETTTDVAVNN